MRDAPLHSQAGNFLDCFKTAVDNRTGQFCLAIALPVPPANQLCGPTLSVTLAFSTLASSCNRGYGLGWSLGLSEINLDQDNPRLSLSSGEQFAIDLINSDPCSDGRLAFFDQKLPTFTVTRQADGNFRVDKQTGESEILRQQDDSTRYLLEEMRSPEGRRLYFDWMPFADGISTLARIRDETRTLLALETEASELRFVLNPQTAHAATLRALLSNERLSQLYLPDIDQPFEIEYDALNVPGQAQLLLPRRFIGLSVPATSSTGPRTVKACACPKAAPWHSCPASWDGPIPVLARAVSSNAATSGSAITTTWAMAVTRRSNGIAGGTTSTRSTATINTRWWKNRPMARAGFWPQSNAPGTVSTCR